MLCLQGFLNIDYWYESIALHFFKKEIFQVNFYYKNPVKSSKVAGVVPEWERKNGNQFSEDHNFIIFKELLKKIPALCLEF